MICVPQMDFAREVTNRILSTDQGRIFKGRRPAEFFRASDTEPPRAFLKTLVPIDCVQEEYRQDN